MMETVFDIPAKAPKINIERLTQNVDWLGFIVICAAATLLLLFILAGIMIFRKKRGR